jgi:hypothetical protein
VKDAIYLNARGVSFAVLTSGRRGEVAPNVEFMGYTQPGHSVRDVAAPVGASMGSITYYLRDGDRVFLAYSTTGRDNEPVKRVLRTARHYALRPRGEAWQDQPGRLARGATRAGTGARTRPGAPLGSDRPPRAAGPALARPSAGTVTTTDATPVGPAEP